MKYWRRLGAISPTLCEDSGWKTQILAEGVMVNKKTQVYSGLSDVDKSLWAMLGVCEDA